MGEMALVEATEDSEKGFVPTPVTTEMLEAMGRFNDEPAKAHILLAADGITPSSQGKRIAFDGPGRTVFDGPFPIPANWWPGTGSWKSRTWTRRWPG